MVSFYRMFAIVVFNDSVSEIIPVKWFYTEEEDECFWPEYLPLSKVSKLVSQQANHNPAWKKYNVRCLGKAATYERAREKLKLSENSSDLNLTENENTEKANGGLKRKRVSATQHFQFDSDSEEYSDVRQNQLSNSQTAESSITIKSTTIKKVSFQIQPSPLHHKTSSNSCIFSSSPLPEKPSQLKEQLSFSSPALSSDFNIVSKSTMSVLKEILKCQQEIKMTQERHSAILNGLLRNNNIDCHATQLPEEINLLLPLKSLGALEEFELKLRDADTFKTVVLYLSDQGGRNLVETIGRIMEKLVLNELARSCNLCGRNGKKGLKETLLFLILNKAVKRNALTAKSNARDVEIGLSNWLTGSRDRDGNRAKRTKASKNKTFHREVSPDVSDKEQ